MTLSPLSAEELSQIRERAEMATQGPWRDAREIDLDRAADRRFVNHARSDIPRLLETVAYWQEEAEKLKKALKPFATIGARLSEGNQAVVVDSASYQGSPLLTVGDFRKASLALSERAQGET